MAITIPDRTQIRLTTKFECPMNGHALPNALLDTGMTNPGPVAVSSSGAADSNTLQAQLTPAIGAAGAAGYVGYQPDINKAIGSAVSAVRNVIVDGFSGVTPGAAVYIDSTGADASSTASGLTHTVPTAGLMDREVNAGDVSATATVEIDVPAGATTLTALELVTNANAAASDTNYWTLSAVNKGTNGSGSTALLNATDINTTKATGGNGGYAAFVENAATLTGTAGNLAVSPGQVLALTLTKTASAPNLTGLVVRATFSGPVNAGKQIGVGWTSTKILFH